MINLNSKDIHHNTTGNCIWATQLKMQRLNLFLYKC